MTSGTEHSRQGQTMNENCTVSGTIYLCLKHTAPTPQKSGLQQYAVRDVLFTSGPQQYAVTDVLFVAGPQQYAMRDVLFMAGPQQLAMRDALFMAGPNSLP